MILFLAHVSLLSTLIFPVREVSLREAITQADKTRDDKALRAVCRDYVNRRREFADLCNKENLDFVGSHIGVTAHALKMVPQAWVCSPCLERFH